MVCFSRTLLITFYFLVYSGVKYHEHKNKKYGGFKKMEKIYKKLTKEQIKRGVIFSSCLSTQRTEQEGDNIHEVLNIII